MQYVYRKAGISIGRTTYDQIKNGKAVSKSSLKVGDLVFYGTPSAPHHVAMYAGNGKILEAPRTGLNVRIASMGNISAARRIVGFDTGGVPSNDGMAYVHKKERILTVDQTKLFEKFMDLLPKFTMPSFQMPNLAGAGGGNFTFDIDNVINVEGNLDKSVLPELKEEIAKFTIDKIYREFYKRGK